MQALVRRVFRYLILTLPFLFLWGFFTGRQGTELVNRAQTALRWHRLDMQKGHLNQYILPRHQPNRLRAWIVSMPRSKVRRNSVSKQLMRADFPFEIIDAVDGQGELPVEEAHFVESHDRLAAMQAGDKHIRAKVGHNCDLSHVRLLKRMLGDQLPIALVIEDDAQIPSDFTELLKSALAALPDDWDILHLHGCNVKASKQAVRQNIYVNHQSSCTLAYAFRQRFALQMLEAIFKWRLHKDIDDFMGTLTSSGKIQSYITMPFLVNYSELSSNSTIEVWRQDASQ